MNEYNEYLDKKSRIEKISNEQNRIRMLDRILNVKDELINIYKNIRKVILFGSVITKGEFREHSDVDIYIEGLDNKEYFKAKAFLETRLQRDIDLYTETDSKKLVEEICAKGGIIYERKS